MIDELFRRLLVEDIEIKDFFIFAEKLCCDLPQVFNNLSLLFAEKFISGQVSYEDADIALNCIWLVMTKYVVENGLQIVEPCYSIYIAFDEGEYIHGDELDPVEEYTKPLLNKILKTHKQT